MTFYRRLLLLPAALLLALPLRAAAPAADRIVVARDGSGDFTTLQAAIDAVPDRSDRRTLIYIRSGVYYGHENEACIGGNGGLLCNSLILFGMCGLSGW